MAKKDEIIIGTIIFAFGVITVLLSVRMPVGNFRMPGTGMFPLCLGLLLTILSLAHIVQQYLKHFKYTAPGTTIRAAAVSKAQLVIFFSAIIFSLILFERLGYPLSSFMLMAALLWALKVKPWTYNILISFFTALASYLLFVWWLKIPLPRGWIGL